LYQASKQSKQASKVSKQSETQVVLINWGLVASAYNAHFDIPQLTLAINNEQKDFIEKLCS